ncbi:Phosphate regulon transcriptional regulatory protein PhoB (SphR) [Labilithrix luteola]|uniref:diguanylate cyclase n=1 Tax=Labilithrix luteola TaxID=1391654 RepID=A0A0K1Q8E4_9BACT|nr:diguanylate cyclase [Labilithrix luteola]AKV02081.1 Phosphate regulon transcriptional regulatory protein PhoB (SphR) [Labilithrix luteola]
MSISDPKPNGPVERARALPLDDSDSDLTRERESTMLRAAMAANVAGQRIFHSLDERLGDDAHEAICRVLVADDDEATRELIASTLRASGYDVEVATDGHEAVELVARGGFDVVLLDAVMPRMSGVDACRTIKGLRGDDFTGDVPVAMIFAKTDTKSRIEALKIGADGYVCKPFEQTELLVCVSSALRTKRAQDALRATRARLERLRSYDELTGAHSFAFLHDRLASEFEKASLHAEPLACCILDVDGLKVQNERGGRSHGDRVLSGIVEVIKSSVRDTDIVARYGGDEFFVMLPATHFAGSLVVASRIWRDVAAKTFSGSNAAASRASNADQAGVHDAHVTVSVGVALYPSRDVRTKEALLGALEAALLEAKRKGGNRLCVFQQEGFIYTPSAGAPEI